MTADSSLFTYIILKLSQLPSATTQARAAHNHVTWQPVRATQAEGRVCDVTRSSGRVAGKLRHAGLHRLSDVEARDGASAQGRHRVQNSAHAQPGRRLPGQLQVGC